MEELRRLEMDRITAIFRRDYAGERRAAAEIAEILERHERESRALVEELWPGARICESVPGGVA